MQSYRKKNIQSGRWHGYLPLLFLCAGVTTGILTVKERWLWKVGEWEEEHRITVFSRESGSGTRSAFLELFSLWEEKGEGRESTLTQEAVIVNRSGMMLAAIALDPYAVGYGSMMDQLEGVRAVRIDQVEPSLEHVQDGSYPYVRGFYMAVRKGDAHGRAFLRYALSEEGQHLIKEMGYIPVVDEGVAARGEEGTILEGRFVVAGSSSVMPLAERLAENLTESLAKSVTEKRQEAEVELQESDSGSGMYMLLQGVADVALLSRELTEEEKEQVDWAAVALDGIVVLVHESNPIISLEREQVRRIFMGRKQRWSE